MNKCKMSARSLIQATPPPSKQFEQEQAFINDAIITTNQRTKYKVVANMLLILNNISCI